MSQARITLRPPPNVEFVEGYPGIPAGPDRPHAEVKGTIELRLPAQGTKAKWIRVELKKVETLPGGGPPNTFFDFVGQSPVKVWEADGEWSLLDTRDFSFAIRIPESIPPSINLERGAGIKYELNATLCVKGKKGFFFKKKDTTLTTSYPIVIDKHELHSTWPVYSQPESRHVVEDFLILTVDRTRTCYGPGDSVKVVATFKNDGIPAAALRAFEFLLKETIIYRAGPHLSGKKGAPQVHVTPIGEQKLFVNMSVYQGQQHKAELGCFIPQTHTNTTVSAARHMDIAYSINVKAVLATGKPLLMELPVTVSNWPRNMSIEAVRRIGPAPSLSLIAPIDITHHAPPNTVAATRPKAQLQAIQPPVFNTAPARSGLFPPQHPQHSDRAPSQAMSQGSSQYGDPVTGPRSNYNEFGFAASGQSHSAVPRGASPAIGADYSSTAMRRPPLSTNPARRLTLANVEIDGEADTPLDGQSSSPRQNSTATQESKSGQSATTIPSTGGSSSSATAMGGSPQARTATGPQRTAWLSAEEEKQRLYFDAKQQAMKIQATMVNSQSSVPMSGSEVASISMPVPEPAPAPAPSKRSTHKNGTPWPTAEEEKLRLYAAATNAARRTQAQGLAEGGFSGGSGINGGSPPGTKTSFSDRPGSGYASSSTSHDAVALPAKNDPPTEVKSTGVQLYQHAMASMSKKPPVDVAPPQAADPPSPPQATHKPTIPTTHKSLPTAEEEKAALRYYEAKRAVDRHQQGADMDDIGSSSAPGEGPIPYEDLYPAGPSPGQAGSSHVVNGYGHGASEASNADEIRGPPPPISPPFPLSQASLIQSAMSEKERLRRKYEAEDAAAGATAAGAPPIPPARHVSESRASPPGYGSSSSPPSRSQPLPPVDFNNGPRLMTAAEEKARLRAQMEAEEAVAAAGSGSGSGGVGPLQQSPPSNSLSRATSLSYANREPDEEFVPPPPPPPLAPRPPAEYIQQTKEEDVRSQAEHVDLPADSLMTPAVEETRVDFGLPFRPFSPFELGVNFDSMNGRSRSVPPPPPLPPKVPVSQ